MGEAPPDARYCIRYGSRHLHSDNTKKLFEAFLEAVRAFEMPVLPHIWGLGGVCTKCGEKFKKDQDEACPVRTEEYKKS